MTAAAPASLDHDAMLAALVLDPATYSRNRFFDLYKDPKVRRARRRAAMLRSALRHLANAAETPVEVAPRDDGGAVVTYALANVGLKRTLVLDSLEMALMRFALGRAGTMPPGLTPDAAARDRVAEALERLAPR